MSGRAFLKRLWVLMAIVFVDMLGFLIVLPLLPFYAEDLGASETMVGVLISAFAFAQLTTAPFWGKLSDRYGRRPMILIGLILSTASYVLFGLASTNFVQLASGAAPSVEAGTLGVMVLLISRLVQGMGAGNIGVVQAYVSDAVPAGSRTQALGWVTVATSAGVMIGPAVGSLSTELGNAAPGFVAAAFCLLNFVFAWFLLPESAEESARELEGAADAEETNGAAAEKSASDQPVAPQSLGRSLRQVLFHPRSTLATLIWVYALAMMAFMAMNGVVALYLERVFDFTKMTIGWFYFYVGAVSTLMRGFVLGPVVKRLGEVRTLRVGVASIATGLLVMPFAGNLISLGLVVLLVPIGTALLFPATTSLVSQCSPKGEVGQNLGVQQAFGGVSRMVGPLWATAAFQYLSIQAPFWIAAGLTFLVFLITLRVPRSEGQEAQKDQKGRTGQQPESEGLLESEPSATDPL